jgi:hypothetical protein
MTKHLRQEIMQSRITEFKNNHFSQSDGWRLFVGRSQSSSESFEVRIDRIRIEKPWSDVGQFQLVWI